jgi:ubiquinone/menaquinone biosynthesis C-methylase UbiE
MKDPMQQWECQDGAGFLRSIGVHMGDTVLDFGCRVGHYSIPAAFAVGDAGRVYALDKDPAPLRQLMEKVTQHGLSNVVPIETDGSVEIDMARRSIDVVLLYDVLHYFTRRQRRRLYQQMFRVLRPAGLLSVFPKHTAEDTPSQEFTNVHVADVECEVRMAGFERDGCWEAIVSHDDSLIPGQLLNFRKGRRAW